MLSARLNKTFLSVISATSLVSSLALAQFRPGPPHGGGGFRPGSSRPSNPPSGYGSFTRKAISGNLLRCTVKTNVSGRYNQLYIGLSFMGNFENGSYAYNQDHELENALRNYYQNGRCNYGAATSYPSEPSYPSYPSNPTYPSYPSEPSHDNIVKRVSIQSSVANQTMDLRRWLSLDSRYDGYRVVSVSASTTPNSPGTTIAKLMVNGYVMASERNPGYEIYLSPAERVRLDSAGTNVSLQIEGSTYIQEIQIELSRY